MGVPSMPELIIILVIVVLLFGAKKIPDLAQGLGKGIKNFKKAMSDDEEKEKISDEKEKNQAEEKPQTENKSSTEDKSTTENTTNTTK